MKAIACADLHIDKNRRFEDTKDILRQIATYAIKNRIEQIWILGDIYERSRPYSSERILFHGFVKSLSDKNIVVLILPGNHGMDADTLSAVGEFGILDLPNVKLINNPTVLEVENGKIYLGHFLVNGAKLGASDYTASNAINLQEVLKTKADLYLLGDVHKTQKLNTNPDVLYVGSPDRIDFGERDEVKGFVLVEASKLDIKPSYTFTELNTRPMVQLNIPSGQTGLFLPDSPYPDTTDAIVKVVITCTKEEYKKIDEAKIREELKTSQSVKIEYNIIKDERTRQANISEGCTYQEAFTNYAQIAEFDEITVGLGLDIINDN